MVQQATFAGGCFWCTETVFKRVKGVLSVIPGYSGGSIANPSYEQVSSGSTGHAEVVQIEFDPGIVQYKTLVKIFFGTHNPTTLNQQGNDIGEQYRSVIFYHNDEQKCIAQEVIDELRKEKLFNKPIMTVIERYEKFFEAENYHKDYYEKNPEQAYCQAVISPKLKKFKGKFKEYLQ